jgi:hypothetical protein
VIYVFGNRTKKLKDDNIIKKLNKNIRVDG